MTRFLGSLAVALALAAVGNPAADLEIRSSEIGEFGMFEPVKVGTEGAPGTSAGIVNIAKSMRLLERTDRIPRSRGVVFGFMFSVEGTPNGKKIPVEVTVIHPRFTDPKTGKTSERETWAQEPTLGLPSFAGWSFDEEWDRVPGQWTIRVSVKPGMVVEKVFTVY